MRLFAVPFLFLVNLQNFKYLTRHTAFISNLSGKKRNIFFVCLMWQGTNLIYKFFTKRIIHYFDGWNYFNGISKRI